MPSLRCLLVLCGLVVCALCTKGQSKDKDVSFPTDDEIRLLVTQTDRALSQYKPLLDQEQEMLGKEGADAVAKDREVIAGLELGIKGFAKNPQGFNGPLGFTFFEWIDDSSRNAMLCSSNAQTKALSNLLDGKTDQAKRYLQLSQSCNDASTLLYTVSENAGALYTRYVEGMQKVAEEGARVSQRCGEILKQKGTTPKQ
jgi:hypothetical protein